MNLPSISRPRPGTPEARAEFARKYAEVSATVAGEVQAETVQKIREALPPESAPNFDAVCDAYARMETESGAALDRLSAAVAEILGPERMAALARGRARTYGQYGGGYRSRGQGPVRAKGPDPKQTGP